MLKIIRKILVVFLSIILSVLLMVMIVTIPLHQIVNQNLLNDLVKEQLTDSFSESLPIEKEKIEQAIQDDEVQQLIYQYVDKTVDALVDDSSIEHIHIGEDLKEILVNHQEVLMKELNLNQEEFQEILNSSEFESINQEYKEVISNMREDMDPDTLRVLSIYHFFGSSTYFIIIIGGIVAIVFSIMLVQWSLIRFMIPVGVASIVAGGVGFLLSYGVKILLEYALEEIKNFTHISISPIIYYSLAIFGIGVFFVVVYSFYYHFQKKNIDLLEE